MKPIALYPSDSTLKKSAMIGASYLFGAYQISSWAPDVSGYVPAICALFGLGVIAQTGWRFLRPSPSFEADERGFTIMGKKRRGWNEYRGVRLHTVRVGFLPVAKWVVVKTGKSILGRRTHIKFTHLSRPAEDMAAEIHAYAKHAQRKACLTEALAGLPVEKTTGGARAPACANAARRPVAPSGPVQCMPSFGERIFGRRKVI